MVLRLRVQPRKVREGRQVENLTPLQERPKYTARYRDNGVTGLPEAVEGTGLQDVAKAG